MAWKILCILCCFSTVYGQDTSAPSRWAQQKKTFYGGIEGIIFANHDTQFIAQPPTLLAGYKALEPTPALVAGYRITARLSAEAGLFVLPVATSYSYLFTGAYSQGSGSYTANYIYFPLRGVFQVLGTGHRLGVSVLAGGGPAFTDTSVGQLVSPNSTMTFTITGPDGTTRTTTSTQRLIQQQGSCAVFEAGVRGHLFLTPRLALNLTVRQLWSPTSSVRDIHLDIVTPSDHLTATMTTPLRGIATGLGIYYSF